MAELRTKLNGFQSKLSEYERISNVAKSLNKNRSEYLRDLAMKDVIKQEKKIKG